MNIHFLPRFGVQGASSRMRTYQYIPALQSIFDLLTVSPLFPDEMLLSKYNNGHYRWTSVARTYLKRAALLLSAPSKTLFYIEKEVFPWLPAFLELLFLRNRRYVLDYDDAIFHKYDLHRSALIRRIHGRKIDRLMSGASLVVAGNQYLANRAIAAGAKCVEVIPTVVDLDRYPPKAHGGTQINPRVVWIGSPSTTQYVKEISESLRKLFARVPFTLRLIGATPLDLPGIDVEYFSWSAQTEASLIAECDIGIMPLKDTPWEQGKCAYKLIQYMASGLPTVSSPVGANLEVVVNGETGLFASSNEEWESTLYKLLQDASAREQMGGNGRKRVEEKYSLQATRNVLSSLLMELADTSAPAQSRRIDSK